MSSETASRGCSPCRITRSMRPLSVLVLSTVGPNRSSRRIGEGVQKSRRFPACQRVFLANAGIGSKPDWTIGSELARRDTGNRVDQIFGLGTVIPAPGGFVRTGLEEWCSSQRSLWSSDKGHVGDVLASRGDEGRGRLRKAWGSCQTSI